MRKMSSGVAKSEQAYGVVLKSFRQGQAGLGRLSVTIPPRLLLCLGLRPWQRLKVIARRGGIVFEQRRVSSAIFKTSPRKLQGADRIRFERKLAKIIRELRGAPLTRRARIVIPKKSGEAHAADGPASSWLAPVELLEKSPSPGWRGSLHP